MTSLRFSSFPDPVILDHLDRTGALKTCRQRGWLPIVQHERFNYIRMLRFAQTPEVRTRTAGQEDGFICFGQEFVAGGQVCATSRMAARPFGRRKARATSGMARQAIGVKYESPPRGEPCRRIPAGLQARG